MNIKVEFLLTHKSDIFDISRVPCIGEHVCLDDEIFEVKDVMHILNGFIAAIVRVK